MVRVFGETPGGQKACLHLHRAFPYFYVPYDDDLPRDPVEAGAYLRKLASSLESAMEMVTQARGTGGGEGGGTGSGAGGTGAGAGGGVNNSRPYQRPRRRFVHDATLVRGRPFYGYHAGERLFVKVKMYDPSTVKRAATAMLSGGIVNRVFQPHESHVPYLLQVMVDYNLHGMGLARLRRVTFRSPVPRWEALHRNRRPTRRVASTGGGDRPAHVPCIPGP